MFWFSKSKVQIPTIRAQDNMFWKCCKLMTTMNKQAEPQDKSLPILNVSHVGTFKFLTFQEPAWHFVHGQRSHKSKASKFPVLKASSSIRETENIKIKMQDWYSNWNYLHKKWITIRYYGYNIWHDNEFRQSIMLYREESKKKKFKK